MDVITVMLDEVSRISILPLTKSLLLGNRPSYNRDHPLSLSTMSSGAETKPEFTAGETTSTKTFDPESSQTGKDQSTYTGMATSAVSNVATTASTAAAGVKDNVFSMFGGGAKKDKKDEDDTKDQDRSGSSKAQKDAGAEDDEVHLLRYVFAWCG